MPFLVIQKAKSNHKKVIGLFEQESQAKMFLDLRKRINPFMFEFMIETWEFMDSCPELVEYALSDQKH